MHQPKEKVSTDEPTATTAADCERENNDELNDLLADIPSILKQADKALRNLRGEQMDAEEKEQTIADEETEEEDVQLVQEPELDLRAPELEAPDVNVANSLQQLKASNVALQKAVGSGFNQIYRRLGRMEKNVDLFVQSCTVGEEDFKWPIKDLKEMDDLLAKLNENPKLRLKLVN